MHPAERIERATLKHGVGSQRLAAGTRVKLEEIYDEGVAAAAAVYAGATATTIFSNSALFKGAADDKLSAMYVEARRALEHDLAGASTYEAAFHRDLLATSTASMGLAWKPATDTAIAAAARPVVAGRTVASWSTELEVQQRRRAAVALHEALSKAKEPALALVAGLRKSLRIGRQHMATMATSLMTATSARAAAAVAARNANHLLGYYWSSILDSRTSAACYARHGLLYGPDHEPVGHSMPWGAGPGALHMKCRSEPVPRVRGAGELPGFTSPEQWLRTGPRSTVDSIFGPTRARMVLGGKASAADLLRGDGIRFIKLDSLAAFDAAA